MTPKSLPGFLHPADGRVDGRQKLVQSGLDVSGQSFGQRTGPVAVVAKLAQRVGHGLKEITKVVGSNTYQNTKY